MSSSWPPCHPHAGGPKNLSANRWRSSHLNHLREETIKLVSLKETLSQNERAQGL